MPRPIGNHVNRFWSKVNKTDDCWEWTGGKNSGGYGRFVVDGSITLAHRYSVELDGRDPTGKFVCHHCDNPSCVNPEHLFVGTNHDNVKDMMNKNRHGLITAQPKLRTLSDDNVRFIRASVDSDASLAKKYHVSRAVVWLIRNNKSYKDVA